MDPLTCTKWNPNKLSESLSVRRKHTKPINPVWMRLISCELVGHVVDAKTSQQGMSFVTVENMDGCSSLCSVNQVQLSQMVLNVRIILVTIVLPPAYRSESYLQFLTNVNLTCLSTTAPQVTWFGLSAGWVTVDIIHKNQAGKLYSSRSAFGNGYQ